MKKIILFLFILYSIPSFGEVYIRLLVTDESAAPLSYCDVFVKDKFHLLTDEKGRVCFDNSLCVVGDIVHIYYLGYEPYQLIITSGLLNGSERICQLVSKSYVLEDVIVQGTFDAARFFKEKKKTMLLPYLDKHVLFVTAKINYVDKCGKSLNVSGNMNVLFQLKDVEIVDNNCIQDTLLQARIKRAIQLASYIPYSFCVQKIRKMYSVSYLGMRDDKWSFVFDIKPECVTHPHFGFQKGDMSPTHLMVDRQGFISSIETHTIIKSGKSRSYNLHADYVDYKSQMVPTYINVTLIEDKMNIELRCGYE